MRFRKKNPELNWERIAALHQQGGEVSRACEDIYRMIFLEASSADLKTLLFTSAVEAEGKTAMALHFAAMLGTKGKRVLLVDVHWRRPALGRILGVAERPGVTDLLENGGSHKDLLIQDSRLSDVFVLPRGTRNVLVDVAAVERLGAFLKHASEEFDIVLLDAAPTASGPEVLLLNGQVQGVVLVVACDRTQRPQVATACRAIEKHGGKLVGVVLSRVPRYLPAYYNSA